VVDTRPRLRSDEPSRDIADRLMAPVCEDLAYLKTVDLCGQSEITAAGKGDQSASEAVIQGDLVGGKANAWIVVDRKCCYCVPQISLYGAVIVEKFNTHQYRHARQIAVSNDEVGGSVGSFRSNPIFATGVFGVIVGHACVVPNVNVPLLDLAACSVWTIERLDDDAVDAWIQQYVIDRPCAVSL